MSAALVRVLIPASLRRHTGGVLDVCLPATTVRDVFEGLEGRFPGIRERLCDDDRIKPGLAVAINSRIGAGGFSAAIPPGAEVSFVHAVAGG
jgi:molybdopterin converting factor small subunit